MPGGIKLWIMVAPSVIFLPADFSGRKLCGLFLPCVEHLQQFQTDLALVLADTQAGFSFSFADGEAVNVLKGE